MKFDDAINLDRKSGGAQWRDLRFPSRSYNYSIRITLIFVIPTGA
jgi:hypothetical protein